MTYNVFGGTLKVKPYSTTILLNFRLLDFWSSNGLDTVLEVVKISVFNLCQYVYTLQSLPV